MSRSDRIEIITNKRDAMFRHCSLGQFFYYNGKLYMKISQIPVISSGIGDGVADRYNCWDFYAEEKAYIPPDEKVYKVKVEVKIA